MAVPSIVLTRHRAFALLPCRKVPDLIKFSLFHIPETLEIHLCFTVAVVISEHFIVTMAVKIFVFITQNYFTP